MVEPGAIGIYDSRAIAVAFAGSAAHEAKIREMREGMKRAEAKGDEQEMRKWKRLARDAQERMHYQGFSTEPVDDILALREPEIKELMQDKGLAAVVSKWDKKTLRRHKGARQVDVTEDLMVLFHPKERQKKSAQEIQKVKPYSKTRLRTMLLFEGGH